MLADAADEECRSLDAEEARCSHRSLQLLEAGHRSQVEEVVDSPELGSHSVEGEVAVRDSSL